MSVIAIVGNAPLTEADRLRIAAADTVCRFNLTPNIRGEPDARTDELSLACSSKQIGDYFARGLYRDDPAFLKAGRLVLPYHPEIIRRCMRPPSLLSRLKGRRADWTDACLSAAKAYGKSVEIISPEAYDAAARVLGISGVWRDHVPSSGFLAIERALTHGEEIHVFGFTFRGWHRHAWDREEAIVRAHAAAGRLTLHAASGAAAASVSGGDGEAERAAGARQVVLQERGVHAHQFIGEIGGIEQQRHVLTGQRPPR